MTNNIAELPPLVAHGKILDISPNRMGWLTPSDAKAPIRELQAQYREQGYLWLKNILPHDRVLEFRGQYFAAFEVFGLLKADTPVTLGIAAEAVPVSAEIRHMESLLARWTVYEAFCLMPEIITFYEAFLGGRTYLHKRKLIRRTAPGSEWSTPAHYDLVYLRGGTDKSLCTSWIPIGDIPVEMGGLIYLEGTDAKGREIEAEFTRKNAALPPEERISAYNQNMREGGWLSDDLPYLAGRFDTRWLIANYEAGDMVIHSPYMIHAAPTNQDRQRRMRLSTDIRYQLADDKIDKRWTADWYPGDNL
jgi:ectoine hydroxylase-related dioxygenase (phytanoyl-CoA dioxygenase family)